MATAKAYLNIKLDKGIKETAAQLLESMGLDHTTAIDMYYRQIIKERRLPFQPESALSLDEQMLATIKAKNIPEVALELDENGNAIVDKEKHPELYNQLVVRIWGWSAYFTDLDKRYQDHVMARQEYGI